MHQPVLLPALLLQVLLLQVLLLLLLVLLLLLLPPRLQDTAEKVNTSMRWGSVCG
jgi:hypothetical protein